jgi:hypothetical protein
MSPEDAASHVEIQQVLQRYGQALDEKRYELLDEVFAPGAVLDYEMNGGQPSSHPEMVAEFREFLASFFYTQHLFSLPVIDLKGDRAQSTCRLIATHVQRPLAGGRSAWTVYGVYNDELIQTEVGWRIARRRFRGTHTEGELLDAASVQRFESA